MTPTFIYISTLFFVSSFTLVAGHVALWDESMFGRCGNNNICANTEQPVDPLQDLSFDQWWWHGYLDFPPVNDSVMSLPAGDTVTVQLAGNVAFTKLGPSVSSGAEWPGGALPGTKNESVVSDTYWNDFNAGNLHTTGKADVGGCALSIAYTDDPKSVRPEDMVVFSVQHLCVWHRDTEFAIPADMPPCPNGKCMCSWWWIHNSNGGSDQNYQTAFQCNITHAPGQPISTTPVGKPVPPVKCTGEADECIKGPKMPMYWKNQECNNMLNPGHDAPTYNDSYGFYQGAQNDIFETVNESNWTCPQSKAPGVFATQTKVQAPSQNQTSPEPSTKSSHSTSSQLSSPTLHSSVASVPTKSSHSTSSQLSSPTLHSSVASVPTQSSSRMHKVSTTIIKASSTTLSEAHATQSTNVSVPEKTPSSCGAEHTPSQKKSSVRRHSANKRRILSRSFHSYQ